MSLPLAMSAPVYRRGAPDPYDSHLKPPVGPEALAWRELRRDPFWQAIPAWREIDEATFLDHLWQERNAVTSPAKLMGVVRELVDERFLHDAEEGFRRAPMSVRVTPYVLSLIDWNDPYADPLRRQFIPVASQLEPDHPMLSLDSLHEQADAPVPGLTHRYPDKALFLALDSCPVYCRFCTRSYSVGLDTQGVSKVKMGFDRERWEAAFRYIAERPELEDVVVSGGDAYRLKPEQLAEIGNRLLDIPHVRRFRFATKGAAILPMKLLSDAAWVDALGRVVDRGRAMGKAVAVHTHFNHPNEITGITSDALQALFSRGITVRNQSVLQRGVNDDPGTMIALNRRLGWINVQPYYVYMHDLVKGTEDLRTPLWRGVALEKQTRGATAGYNTPTFVVDAPGGGGKRNIHSFEHYDKKTGVSVYAAPAVRPGELFLYVDPLASLAPAVQRDWHEERRRREMTRDALATARRKLGKLR
ncbi:MAG TPA: KamA family radical SAM protein [Thermoanaerobaculia bacterium]|nr:KamA family radical SAM protein [Thermoanaerobaculia bacterium]